MQIEMMPTDRPVPYLRKARTHYADLVAKIAASIAEFGFTNPILIGEDEVANMSAELGVEAHRMELVVNRVQRARLAEKAEVKLEFR